MKEKKDRSLALPKEANEGFFKELINNIKLIIRLLKDKRVNFWLKFLPVGALIYLVFPMDVLPINPLDDAVVVWLGGYLFIELCPQDVVQEHKDAIKKVLSGEDNKQENPPEVIDGEFKEKPLNGANGQSE